MQPDFTKANQWDNDDIQYVDIDLTNAREKPEALGLAGKKLFVSLLAWDDKYTISSTLEVGRGVVTLNNAQGNPIELSAGLYYDFGGEFTDIFLRNSAQPGKMLRVVTSIAADIQPFSGEIQVVGTAATVLNTVADVAIAATTAAEVLPANSARREALISNLAANATVVRVGDSFTGANRGAEIPAGGSAALDGTEAIYVYNPSAGAINIGVTYSEE